MSNECLKMDGAMKDLEKLHDEQRGLRENDREMKGSLQNGLG